MQNQYALNGINNMHPGLQQFNQQQHQSFKNQQSPSQLDESRISLDEAFQFVIKFISKSPQINYNHIWDMETFKICLQKLCHNKALVSINPNGSALCSICDKFIDDSNVAQNIRVDLPCAHCVHKECLKSHCQQIDKYLSPQKLSTVKCAVCAMAIPWNIIMDAFGEEELNRIQTQETKDLNNFFLKEDRQERQKIAEAITFNCAICDNNYKINEILTLECNHRFCKDCIETFVKTKLDQNLVSSEQIICPSCDVSIDVNIIKELLSAEEFQRFDDFRMSAFQPIDPDEKFLHCPSPDCKLLIVFNPKNLSEHQKQFKCNNCNNVICLNGCIQGHEHISCEQFRQQKSGAEAETKFVDYVANENVRQCNRCKAYVERIDGCNHMTCRCKYEFCYKCGKKWMCQVHSYYD